MNGWPNEAVWCDCMATGKKLMTIPSQPNQPRQRLFSINSASNIKENPWKTYRHENIRRDRRVPYPSVQRHDEWYRFSSQKNTYIPNRLVRIISRQGRSSNGGNEKLYKSRTPSFQDASCDPYVSTQHRPLKYDAAAPVHILQMLCGEEIHAR